MSAPDSLPETAGSAAADSLGLVQQLFERRLGPARTLPHAVAAASSTVGADFREKERVSFRAARGVALDYQAVPFVGTLLGMQHTPERPAPLPKAQPRPPPLSASLLAGTDAAGGSGPALEAAATSAAPTAPRTAAPRPQRAQATLWGIVQPSSRVGVETALSVCDAGELRQEGHCAAGFCSWHQRGFLDLSRRLGFDYSLEQLPKSATSAEVKVSATLPKLLLLPEVELQHSLEGAVREGRAMRRTSMLSAPLPGGAAEARVQVQHAAGGAADTSVTLELRGSSKRQRGLAGGAKLQAGLSSAFHGSTSSSSSSIGSKPRSADNGNGEASGSSSDSEDEDGSCSKACGTGSSQLQQQGRRRVPGLRLQAMPATARSWEDVNGHWHQVWGKRLSSKLGYQAKERKWNMELTSKLSSCLTATGAVVCRGPPDAAAALSAAAAGPADSAGDGENGGSSSRYVSGGASTRVQHLQRCLRAYVGGSQLCNARLRLTCRLRRPTRQQLHLESSLSEEGKLRHAVRFRLGGGALADFQQQRARCELALVAQPCDRTVDLKFDFFAPL